jgi:hypothetical protein
MLGCGNILLALALLMAAPVATMAQTTDNRSPQSGRLSELAEYAFAIPPYGPKRLSTSAAQLRETSSAG